jgi:hypothetical protein
LSSSSKVLVSFVISCALGFGLLGCSSSGSNPLNPPDLAALVSSLTSTDPGAQEAGLAPALRTSSGPPLAILPAGSSLVVDTATWDVMDKDDTGEPYTAKVDAKLTRPGQPVENVSLHLMKVDKQWLLYETAPA